MAPGAAGRGGRGAGEVEPLARGRHGGEAHLR